MAAKFKKNILMWLLWLIMIIIWNYVWPQANPPGCISFCDFRCRFSCFKEISKNLILVPTAESNRRPFPYHGNALPTELYGLTNR